ncbi:thiamine pyrophosphate-dependent enzyme [Kocuria rhizophila]|nr:thiamine pyrophosphate-dependent enzyme [Kocuria rhizophila]
MQAIGQRSWPSRARQVISMSGDGGLSMLMGELLTLAAYNLPVTAAVFSTLRWAWSSWTCSWTGCRTSAWTCPRRRRAHRHRHGHAGHPGWTSPRTLEPPHSPPRSPTRARPWWRSSTDPNARRSPRR